MIPAAATSLAVSRSLQARFERAVLLLLWVGIVGFTLASDSYVYLACATVAVVVHYVGVLTGRDIRLRRALVTVAALGAAALATVEIAYLEEIKLVAAAHFLLMLQVCKLFESRRSRDCAQLLGMNVLLMVSAALLVDKLWMALVLAAYMGLFCYVSVLYTLKRGLEMVQPKQKAPGADDAAGRVGEDDFAVVTALPRGAVGVRAALLLLVLVEASVAGFILVPRGTLLAEHVLGLSADRRATQTGFKLSVELTGSKAIYQSDRVAMQVTVHFDEPGTRLDAERTYLRGAVLTHYADSRWYTPERPPSRLARGRLVAPGRTIFGGTDRFHVLLQPALLPTLFTPYPAVWVGCQMDRQRLKNFLLWDYDATENTDKPVWYVAYCLRRPLDTEKRNYVRAAEGPVRPASEGMKLPQRVGALAAEWCSDLLAERRRSLARRGDELNLAIAQRIVVQLRQHCSYTLSIPPVDASRDGVEYFLFDMKQGHCEYFASALTVMCRALDVPARLVTGFRMLEQGRRPGEYVVRDRDAHAWTEVYVPQEGWVIVDATPSGRARRKSDSLWSAARNGWEDMQLAWASRVVAYDNTSRARLANVLTHRLLAAAVNAGGSLSNRTREFARTFLRTTLGMVTLGVAVLGLGSAAAAAGLLLVRYLHARRRRAAASRRAEKVSLEFLRRLIRLLEARGLKRRASHTVREVLDLAAQRFNLPADVLGALIVFYYAYRWGGRVPTPGQMAAAKRQAEQIAARLVRPGRPPRPPAAGPAPNP